MTSRSSTSVVRVAVTSIGSGVLTALLPPARLPAAVRRSLHAVLGLGAGGAVLLALSQGGAEAPDGEAVGAPGEAAVDGQPLPVPARIAVATAVGALVTASSVGGAALDTKVEHALARRGATHPRLWIGAAATLLSAVSALADRHLDSDDMTATPGPAGWRAGR